MDEQPLLQVTIARTPEHFGPRRQFNVKAEMASGPRPAYRRANSKSGSFCSSSPRRSVDVEVDFTAVRNNVRHYFTRRFLPLALGSFCAICATSSLAVDYNTRLHHSMQHRYERFAVAHNEKFAVEEMPTVTHIVDTLTAFRRERSGDDNGFINMDNKSPEPPTKELELLAIGPAKVAAEALRFEDKQNWSVFVPTSITELLAYKGKSFADSVIIGGEDNINFPPKNTRKILNEKGVAVHQIPLNSSFMLNFDEIVKKYSEVFGEDRVRVDIVQPGSTLILASKNGELPRRPKSEKYLRTDKHHGIIDQLENVVFS